MDPRREYEHDLHRSQRRSRKKRSHYRLLALLVVLGLFVVLLAELGRTLTFSQDVGHFIRHLEEKTPAEVKQSLDRYARALNDHNPVIRAAAMTVFKFVTGEEFGTDVNRWKQWWWEQRGVWEYTPAPPGPADDLTPIPLPSKPPSSLP